MAIRTAVDLSPAPFAFIAAGANEGLGAETRKTRRRFLKLLMGVGTMGAVWGSSSFVPDIYAVTDSVFELEDDLTDKVS